MKNTYLNTFCVFCLFVCHVCISQTTTFYDAEVLPTAKSATSSANDGQNIYLTNGFSPVSSYTSDIYQYNIATNTWTTLTTNTISKRFGSAAVVGDFLYVFNGLTPSSVYNDTMEVIDLNTGSVNPLSNPNPQPAQLAGVSVWGDKIYSFGGQISSTTYSNKLYEFDTNTQIWTELATMPYTGQTKGEIVNGKLYIFGGFNGSTSDQIHVYDINTDTWESSFTLPTALSANATAIVNDLIYVVGDFSNQTFTGYFDTTNNSFTTTSSNLNGRRHASAEGVNGDLYVMGGNTASSIASSLNSVQTTNTALTIGENSLLELKVFPNPSSNTLYFNRTVDEAIIFDVNGKEIKKVAGKSYIVVRELQNGIYFLKLNDDSNFKHLKWIKR